MVVVGVTGAVRMGRASGRTTALLSFLDLSAAFGIVDHDTLLQRLQTSYGNDIAWFASYVTGRTQYARTAASRSASLAMLLECRRFGRVLS